MKAYIAELRAQKIKRYRLGAVVLALSLFVLSGVIWQLRLKGVAQEVYGPDTIQADYYVYLDGAWTKVGSTSQGWLNTGSSGKETDMRYISADLVETVLGPYGFRSEDVQVKPETVPSGQEYKYLSKLAYQPINNAGVPDKIRNNRYTRMGSEMAVSADAEKVFPLSQWETKYNLFYFPRGSYLDECTEIPSNVAENNAIYSVRIEDPEHLVYTGDAAIPNAQYVFYDIDNPDAQYQITVARKDDILWIYEGMYGKPLHNVQQQDNANNTTTFTFSGINQPIVLTPTDDDILERLSGDNAYIDEAKMQFSESSTLQEMITTGTASFDADDTAGNDSSSENGIIRTFDVATYTLSYKTKLRSDGASGVNGYRTGTVYFELVLPLPAEQGQFETGSMGWLSSYREAKYEIVEATVAGEVCQVLRGSFLAEPSEGNVAAIGNSVNEMSVAIRVLNMKQGEKVQPQFTIWLEGNNVDAAVKDGIPTKIVTGIEYLCPNHSANEAPTVTPKEITVSAAPRYNLALRQADATQTSYLGDFDFASSNALAMDSDAGKRNGRISCFGLTLQLVGKDVTSGLKGVQLPDADTSISFDVRLYSEYKKDAGGNAVDINSTYRPLVWSAGANSSEAPEDGREVSIGINYAKAGAPLNQKDDGWTYVARDFCKNGGSWSFTKDATNPNLLHVTVSGFDIDLASVDNFPAADAGYTGELKSCAYYDPTSQLNAWELQEACFSAGELWIMQPFDRALEDGTMQAIEKEYGDGSVALSLRGFDLKVNGTLTQQVVSADDSQSTGLALKNPGDIATYVTYNKYQQSFGNALTDGCFLTGFDWATQGQKISIENMLGHNNAEAEFRGVAYEQLIKFDDVFFEPDGTYQAWVYAPNGNWTATHKIQWAAKPDGTGWAHGDLKPNEAGYDTEMRSAGPDDLVYYEKLDALRADGKVCVGAMLETRGVATESKNQIQFILDGVVKEDCPEGYVYMTTVNDRVWRMVDIGATARHFYNIETDGDYYGKLDDTEEGNALWAANELSLIDNYVKQNMPHRHSKSYAEKWMVPDTYFFDKQVNTLKTDELHTRLKTALAEKQKISYNEDGGDPTGDHDYMYLDSCMVAPHVTAIRKTTAQKAADGVSAKRTYSMDNSQYIIDYELTPSIIRTAGTGTSGEQGDQVTNVYIEDVLPATLSYIAGSAYWGGTYEQDPDCKNPGTITGGERLAPAVTKNADGTTTLRWTLSGISLSQQGTVELEPIRFSCQILDTVGNGQSIANSASIWSDSDNKRLRTESNNNLAVWGITIQKASSFSIVKLADQNVVEAGADMGFTMYVGNNSANNAQNQIMVESLPYNGDGRGTSFHGTLRLTAFGVNAELLNWTDGLKFYYTSDTSKRGNTSSSYVVTDFTPENGWTEFGFSTTAKAGILPTLVALPEDCVQIVAVGTLPANQTLRMHVTMNIDGGEAGDQIVNQLSVDTLQSNARSRIVRRNLEGFTWLDQNANGLQDEVMNELTQLSHIKVTLLKLKDGVDTSDAAALRLASNYEVYHYDGDASNAAVVIETGQKVSVKLSTEAKANGDAANTAEAYSIGRYQFMDLPSGIFAVRFESGTGSSGRDISSYLASPTKMGSSENMDSDAEGCYSDTVAKELLYTMIFGIEMPTVDEMEKGMMTLYEVKYQDSGFNNRGPILPDTGGIGSEWYTFGGLLFFAGAFIYYINLEKRERKGKKV
ncbi:MAG: LPXTG cell wall anchor domain-containing protein [Faecalimonas sp.]|nr:LPXTG cell wall anchor domain-containing protein [Faecalimonas sp.]